jgi:uncharacterized protein
VILCDTGPLVALVDGDDLHHSTCFATATALPANSLITTWPCLTEAMHLLNRAAGLEGQNGLWSYLADGVLQLHLPAEGEWKRMHELMNQYADMPLDLADASLISAAERLGERELFTIDRLLGAVKLADGKFLQIVP